MSLSLIKKEKKKKLNLQHGWVCADRIVIAQYYPILVHRKTKPTIYLIYHPTGWKCSGIVQDEGKRNGMKINMTAGTEWPFGSPEITLEDAVTQAIFQTYTLNMASRTAGLPGHNRRRQDTASFCTVRPPDGLPKGNKVHERYQINDRKLGQLHIFRTFEALL